MILRVMTAMALAAATSQSHSAPAGWVLIASGDDGSAFYAHVASRRKEGPHASLWVQAELRNPTSFAGKEVVLKKTFYVVDCQNKTLGTRSSSWFSASGDVLRTLSFEKNEVRHEPIAPDSIGQEIGDYACNGRSAARPVENEFSELLHPSADSKAELARLDRSYPGWFEHAESSAFQEWLSRQTPAIKEWHAKADTAAKMLYLLNEHRKSQGLRVIKLLP